MLLGAVGPLFAVHVSDGILQSSWLVGGLIVAGVFAVIGSWRIRDDEVPRIALLTAAFFVASSIHIRVGPTSWHLLFNGLVGVLLGRRAALAIPLGLAMQYFLLTHGGFYTLGINTCIMLLPALLASGLFTALRNARWLRQRWFGAALLGTSALAWMLSSVYSVALLLSNNMVTGRDINFDSANAVTFSGVTIVLAVGIAVLVSRWTTPEFALGLLVGVLTVLVTIALNYLVLVLGGDQVDWTMPARIMLVLHLPIAALEGIVLGFLVSFLARVKPDMLGLDGRVAHADPFAKDRSSELARSAPVVVLDDGHEPGPHDVRSAPGAAGEPDSHRELLPGRKPGR
jgi:cobalt/nickel transport system permease protein